MDPAQGIRWQPELSPSGPISIVISRASHRVVVYRNGIEIGRARLTFVGDEPLAAHALVLAQGASTSPNPYLPDAAKFHWLRIGVAGHVGEGGTDADPAVVARIKIPPEFVNRVNAVMTPGTTVFVTDEALSARTTGRPTQVVDADPPVTRRAIKKQ
jgi:hypothetical protein